MTEAEWLAGADPGPLLDYLRAKGENRPKRGRRKLRLFGCACCRRVERLMAERGRCWLDLAERKEGEPVSAEELDRVGWNRLGAVAGQRPDHQADSAAWFTLASNAMLTAEAAARSAARALRIEAWARQREAGNSHDTSHEEVRTRERGRQADLVREIFGNPFRSVTVDQAWLAWNGGTVQKLAQAIYDERAFDRLPVLADALEEAGCDNADVLAHCRQPGEHVSGCWVIDLLLGRQ
jgi:hypothetical protein